MLETYIKLRSVYNSFILFKIFFKDTKKEFNVYSGLAL